jgi:hypothetical protein
MKFRKKPVVIEAITFEEFIEYGIQHCKELIKGMPWSFDYNGHPITHENDECYLIPTKEGTMRFTPKDMLITGVKGEIYPCKIDIFEATYEQEPETSSADSGAIRGVDLRGLELYIGTKTIAAVKMSECSFLESVKGIDTRNREDQPGYLVEYPDGYRSWSPQHVFEAAYDKLLVLPDGTNYIDEATVFPSEVKTIASKPDADYPGGAHLYQFKNSIGFNNGEAQYHDSYQKIQFVQKNLDGTMIPGLQSEQLVLALLDRAKKLNTRFPSEQNAKMCEGLQIFLDACKERVQDRINRGVMGDHKK